jgi:RluA family pseudouridine synthase
MNHRESTVENRRASVEVSEDVAGDTRVDVFLTEVFPHLSRTKIQRAIKREHVTVNDESVQKSYIVEPGDRIEAHVPKPPPLEAEPEPIPLDIVYEDEYLIIVNKPAGMVVHPARGHRSGTLVNALLHHVGSDVVRVEDSDEHLEDEEVGLSTTNAAPGHENNPVIRPGIVHRLDKDTSGVLVVAKDDVTHQRLSRLFREHTIQRTYQALVWGKPEPPEGSIVGPIGRDPYHRKRMAVVAPGKGKSATTRYRTLELRDHVALVEFELETGRTHQIRVHAQHVGHPVVGDPTYGGRGMKYGRPSRQRQKFFEQMFDDLQRQALHARTLGFEHPWTGEEHLFSADWPEDMKLVWKALLTLEESD